MDPLGLDKLQPALIKAGEGITASLKQALEELLAEQDGWTLTITIPQIKVELKRPDKK